MPQQASGIWMGLPGSTESITPRKLEGRRTGFEAVILKVKIHIVPTVAYKSGNARLGFVKERSLCE